MHPASASHRARYGFVTEPAAIVIGLGGVALPRGCASDPDFRHSAPCQLIMILPATAGADSYTADFCDFESRRIRAAKRYLPKVEASKTAKPTIDCGVTPRRV